MAAVDPRKTPRQSRAAVTVEALLEATAHILEREGLGAVTTNAVAQRAGASIGSLYQYFPNKEALLAALIRRERAALLEDVRRIAQAPPGDLSGALEALVHAAVRHQVARPALARALDFAEPHLPLSDETEALTQSIAGLLVDLLAGYGLPEPACAARDLTALTKGMVDAAGLAGETDDAVIAARVLRAARGYCGIA